MAYSEQCFIESMSSGSAFWINTDFCSCPFCGSGSIAFVDRRSSEGVTTTQMQCEACGSRGPTVKEDNQGDNALGAWNERVEEKESEAI